MKLKQLLMEDARNDIQSRLRRMPFWKKYEMSFDITGAIQPNKMKMGTTKDGRKTYSIAISVANAPNYDWQQLKSVKLIQKYFPDYEVVGRHGTFGGVKSENAGHRTYTFISNKVGESTTRAVSEASVYHAKDVRPNSIADIDKVTREITSRLEHMPVWKKYDFAIEGKIKASKRPTKGMVRFTLSISFPINDKLAYMDSNAKKTGIPNGTDVLEKAIKKEFTDFDIEVYGVFEFTKDGRPIMLIYLQDSGYWRKGIGQGSFTPYGKR